MKFFGGIFLAAAVLLTSCGEDEKKGDVEVLPLKSAKQELSYLIGADHAHQLDKDPNKEKYDKKEMTAGFVEGLNDPKSYNQESEDILMKFLGGGNGGQPTFNAQYLKEGSKAIGKFFGATFNKSWSDISFMSQFDKQYLAYGFELGLRDQDTLIEQKVKEKILSDFMTKVNTRISAEVSRVEKVFFDQVRAKKGIQELPQGLYMETLKAGTGTSPTISDDVRAHYVLMNTNGDTLQSSLDREPVPFNLSGVVPGWSIGIPFMKTGGKYKLYVPNAMGYGANSPDPNMIPPFSTLVFYIELVEVGKAGTLLKAEPKPQQMQGMQ